MSLVGLKGLAVRIFERIAHGGPFIGNLPDRYEAAERYGEAVVFFANETGYTPRWIADQFMERAKLGLPMPDITAAVYFGYSYETDTEIIKWLNDRAFSQGRAPFDPPEI